MAKLPIVNRRDAIRTLAATGVATWLDLFAYAQDLGHRECVPLSVLFLNTHLLPGVAQLVAGHRGQDDYRTQAIAARLIRYDVVGLCEVFETRRRDEIVRRVQEASGGAYSWVGSDGATGRSLIGGGLLLLTRLPIEGEPQVHAYSAASRVYNTGIKADGLAAKGVIHARLRAGPDAGDGVFVDCFLTHLESISAKARARQIEELAAFIAKQSRPEHPVILMGDLNVTADYPIAGETDDTEYQSLVNTLQHAGQPLVDVWPALQAGRGGTSDALAREECRRIDYVLVSQSWGQTSFEPKSVRVEPFLDATVTQGSLSDHAGLEARLAIRAYCVP
jgi:endonuclease/exonuclease/phosphatase family metal-dependent hydrolase